MLTMFGDDSYNQFALVRDKEPRGAVLHVFGDVDLSTVGELNDAIDEIGREGASLLINLSKCRYFDSSGLAALVQARKVLGARLTILADPKSQVSRVFHLVGFDKLYKVVTELPTPRSGNVVFPNVDDPAFTVSSHMPLTTTLGLTSKSI